MAGGNTGRERNGRLKNRTRLTGATATVSPQPQGWGAAFLPGSYLWMYPLDHGRVVAYAIQPVDQSLATAVTAVVAGMAGATGAAGAWLYLRRRTTSVSNLLPILSTAGHRLATSGDPQPEVTGVLGLVGPVLGCMRLELLQVHQPSDGGLPLSSLRAAWAMPGCSERLTDPGMHDRPWHPVRTRWLSELAAGRCLAAPKVKLPIIEREELGDAAAIALVPVLVAGRLWGCLQCLDRDGRVRSSDELAMLSVLGELIAATQCRITATTQLTAARAEAESGDRAKREFLANISHEVRTPLNGVLGMAGLLLDTELAPRQREYAQVVRTSAENLLALLNDLLDLVKTEGEQKVERVRLDPMRLAEDVVAMLSERAHAKGVEIAVHPAEDLPRRILGDATRLRQVLVNLVGNAIKFTARGHVLVRVDWVEDGGGTLIYAVEDTGIGIDAQARAALFTAFTQGDGSTTRRFGGTGLGLAICRRMSELLGGTITCDSQPGHGSTFTVRVPSPEGSTGGSARSAMVSSRLLGTRVLVVEPCAAIRAALACICRRLGLVTEEAASSDEAQRRMSAGGAEKPRVVLSAAGMPGVEMLPAQTAGDGVTVHIMLAAVAKRPPQAEVAQMGFAACLVKPPRTARLGDAICRAIDQADEDTSFEETNAQRKPLRVLVVEDDAVNQMLAKAVLERDGVRVDVAGDGHEALEALTRARYDAVLMDLLMPVMDGFSCAREIRRLEHERGQPAIPIIAVSALDDPDVQARCRTVGMDGSIRKPFEPRHLRRMLRSLALEGRKVPSG
jgi:signal transduction histidine kinase/DNA-binding response OmpR family regulator